jgi:hypothetical protein
LHVVWRGNELPASPDTVVCTVTGR